MSAVDLQELFLERSAPYWRENLDMQAIFYAQATELTAVDERITQYLINEHYIESASDWGLRLLEYKYGLLDDAQRTLEERRGRLRAAKRGGRNATIANMELIASSFVGGEVDIIPDYDNFTVTVEFVDTFGIPTRISDVQAALDKAFPAYWDIVYNYKFNTYGDIKLYFGSYQALQDARLSYRQLLLTDQQVPSYVDAKTELAMELTRYVNESKSLMLNTGYLNYQGLN